MLIVWEVLKMAFKAIITNKLRTTLTLLGIILGVTSVITIISAIEGLGQSIENELARMGPTSFVISQFGMEVTEEAFLEALKRKPIEKKYVPAIEEACTECDKIAVRTFTRRDVKYRNKKLRRVLVGGATSSLLDIIEYEVAYGRFHSPEEDLSKKRVVFVGAGIVEEFYPNVDPIGKEIKISNLKYEIIGVAKKLGATMGENRDNIVFMPYSTMEKDIGADKYNTVIIVSAQSKEVMDIAMDQTRVALRAYRHVPYNKKDDFAMLTADSIMKTIDELTKYMRLGLIMISSISIVVGGIIIMNIMLVAVTERTREIGIRKSLGAKQKDILLQFIFEALILSLGGGLIGIAIGVYLGDLLIGLLEMNMTPSAYAIGLGLGISSGTGLFFGIYPALKAARLQPVVALGHE